MIAAGLTFIAALFLLGVQTIFVALELRWLGLTDDSSFLCACFVLSALVAAWQGRQIGEKRWARLPRVKRILLAESSAVTLAVITVTVFVGVLPLSNGISDWITGSVAHSILLASIRRTVVIIAVAASAILFLFRLKMRCVYGFTEVGVGISIAYHIAPAGMLKSLDAAHSSSMVLALLTSSIYLIIRGLDNMHQGYNQDVLVRWLKARTENAVITDSSQGNDTGTEKNDTEE